MAGPDSSKFPPFQIMASILCLGFALVAALTSTVDAQEASRSLPPRPCSSFPTDTCPVGYTCNRDRICEPTFIDSFPCRFDSECPRNYECRRGRCVPRQSNTNCIFNPRICQPFEYCNRRTGRCEFDGGQPDCRFNPTICGPFQTCNRRTGRCEVDEVPDCRTFPCGPGQTCQYRFGRYQCVSTSCRPWVPQDCPPGYYCSSRRECLPDFPFGGRASGSPAAASTSGDGM